MDLEWTPPDVEELEFKARAIETTLDLLRAQRDTLLDTRDAAVLAARPTSFVPYLLAAGFAEKLDAAVRWFTRCEQHPDAVMTHHGPGATLGPFHMTVGIPRFVLSVNWPDVCLKQAHRYAYAWTDEEQEELRLVVATLAAPHPITDMWRGENWSSFSVDVPACAGVRQLYDNYRKHPRTGTGVFDHPRKFYELARPPEGWA